MTRRYYLLLEYSDGTFRVFEDSPYVLREYRGDDETRATLICKYSRYEALRREGLGSAAGDR